MFPPAISIRPLLALLAGQGLTAMLGLLYGKLTALYISPDEWGQYSLLFAAMTFAHGLLVTPTIQSFKSALGQFQHSSVLRFYGKKLLLIYATVMPLAALAAGLYYQNPLFGLVWLAAIGQGLYQVGNDYLNTQGQHRRYTHLQVSYAVGILISFGWLVVWSRQPTAAGLWQALAITNGVFGILAVSRLATVIRKLPVPRPDWLRLRQSYRQYVRPLLSMAVWAWVLNYGDRYLIRLYLTDADVGQYTMGYSLGAKLLLLSTPVLTFLSPQVLALRSNNQPSAAANPLLIRYTTQYISLAGLVCVLFFAGRNLIGSALLSGQYGPAFAVAPLVAVGYLFLTSLHLLELKWYVYGQTRYILWHTVVGVLVNLALNMLLIPQLGIVGAALATAIGFAAQFAMGCWLFGKD